MTSFPRFDVEGRVALVTGAARGLGRAVALALANAGADVALGLRDVSNDAGLIAETEALGRRALPVPLEVSDVVQVRAAVAAVVEHFGRLDILVNNAGVAPTFIRTPGTQAALSDPVFEADVVERIAALHRIGEPMDVAGAVVYLCSPAASLVTGHTLLVDGGWTAR